MVASRGPAASNGLTAFLSVAATVLVALILQRLGVRGSLLAAFAFAFTPVVYINSTSTIDYVWAVAFVLGATYLTLLEKPAAAGVLLGLAIGCRLTSALMLAPLAASRLRRGPREGRWRDVLVFAASALAAGAVFFGPVWLRHGGSFLSFSEPAHYPDVRAVVVRATTGVWGTVGTLAWGFAGLALLSRAKVVKSRLARSDWVTALFLCTGVTLLYLGAYLRLPLESGYLVPVVPFAIIGLGLVSPERLFRGFCLVLGLAPFADVGRHGVSLGGPLHADHAHRLAATGRSRDVLEAVSQLDRDVIVVCGSMQPRILALAGSGPEAERQYVYLIEGAGELVRYARTGHPIRFLAGAERENLAAYGVDLRRLGAQELRLPAR
jgi:hypothetical protein